MIDFLYNKDWLVAIGLAAMFGPVVAALLPRFWQQLPEADACKCGYSRDGLAAAMPCPECGSAFTPSDGRRSSARAEYVNQIARVVVLWVVCTALSFAIWHGLRLGIVLCYVIDGHSYSTGWKCAVTRELRGEWVRVVMALMWFPMAFLTLDKNLVRAIVRACAIAVAVTVIGTIYGGYWASTFY